MVTDSSARRAHWIPGAITGAALIARAVRLKARRSSAEADAPADAGFIRALHAALRRDLCQLSEAAAHLGNSPSPATVLAG